MVLESLATLFSGLSSAAEASKIFRELLKGKRGEMRALLEEFKKNLTLSRLAVEKETAPLKVIPELSTTVYDRLLESNFDFNILKRKKIQKNEKLMSSDLSSFLGKETVDLVVSIYDRIKEMQVIYKVDRDNPSIDWDRRLLNVHKRILLLMSHLYGWSGD